MAVIRNRLNQRLLINLKDGKTINLLAKGTANVSEEELTLPRLQSLLNKGHILVIQKSVKTKQKSTSKEIEKKKSSQESQQSKPKSQKED